MQRELLAILKDILGGMENQEIDLSTLEAKLAGYGVNKVLWSGGWYMTADHVATLSESISAQPNGIVLVWSRYADSTVYSDTWNLQFVPKYMVGKGGGIGFLLTDSSGAAVARKYIYVSDTSITGNNANTATGATSGSSITWKNNYYVLHYVIGV